MGVEDSSGVPGGLVEEEVVFLYFFLGGINLIYPLNLSRSPKYLSNYEIRHLAPSQTSKTGQITPMAYKTGLHYATSEVGLYTCMTEFGSQLNSGKPQVVHC